MVKEEDENMWEDKKRILSMCIVGLFICSSLTYITTISNYVGAETSITDSQLVLYYSFDNPHWSLADPNPPNYTVKDDSGSGYNGKQYGGTYYNGTSKFGLAMSFDGKSGYVETKQDINLSIQNELTLEAWIYWEGDTAINTIISNNYHYILSINTDDKLLFQTTQGGAAVEGQIHIPTYQWTYIAISRYFTQNNNAVITFYVNGQLDMVQNQFEQNPQSAQSTYIGCSGGNNTMYYFHGIIDEVKIFSKQNSPSTGMGRCVLNLGMEEGNGNITYDRSGMNLYGVINGASWDSNGTYGSRCLAFDGTDDYIGIPPRDILNLQDLTIEAWVYWQGSNYNHTNNTIIAQYNHFWFYINNTGKLCYDGGVNSAIPPIQSLDSVPQNVWTKVAVSRKECHGNNPSTYATIFINGQPENSGNPSLSVSSDWDTYVGCWGSFCMTAYFNGKIDNVQVSNSMNTVGCEVLRYQFETGNASTAVDESPYNNNGSLKNDAQKVDLLSSPYYDDQLTYNLCLQLDGSPNDSYVNISVPTNQTDILDNLTSLTIEARVCWLENNGLSKETIVGNKNDYWLYIDDDQTSPTYEHLIFQTNDGQQPLQVISSCVIPIGKWTYVAVTRYGNGTLPNSVKLYVNGVLDTMGTADPPLHDTSPTYIGTWYRNATYGLQHWFKGWIDNVMISNYAKTFREDTDGDSMADVYEIIRSVDSKEYNSLEYNGRYAILCSPIRKDMDIQFKYDISQLRYYLIGNGWSDCDIIFLTCADNSGRNNSLTIGQYFNPGIGEYCWIDGEAYHDNLGNAFHALENGGSFNLTQSNRNNITYSFAKTSPRDIVYIELNGHGDINYTSAHYFLTYTIDNYDVGLDSLNNTSLYWNTSSVNSELNNISTKYMIIELDMCFAGGWVDATQGGTVAGNYRVVLMAQNDNMTYEWAYLFYARIQGDIMARYVNIIGIQQDETNHSGIYDMTTPGNDESENADGVSGVQNETNHREPIRAQSDNGIISIQEAHHFADSICYDRFGPSNFSREEKPQISIGGQICFSLYS